MAKGQKTGGRVAGTPNKATAEIKAIAQKHGPAAIKEAVRIMTKSESDQARMAAIKELLDRGYGKAAQPVGGGDGTEPVRHLFGWLPSDG